MNAPAVNVDFMQMLALFTALRGSTAGAFAGLLIGTCAVLMLYLGSGYWLEVDAMKKQLENKEDELKKAQKELGTMKSVAEMYQNMLMKSWDNIDVGIIPHSTNAAVMFEQAIADHQYAGAQYWLGCCYARGFGVKKDMGKAVELFTNAAEQGYVNAQHTLGYHYRNGKGVEQDNVKAVEWFTKAAEQGYACAQVHLGFCYDIGEGVEQEDKSKAVEWYTKAAEQGHVHARQALISLRCAEAI
jgi:TPR repeat protein